MADLSSFRVGRDRPAPEPKEFSFSEHEPWGRLGIIERNPRLHRQAERAAGLLTQGLQLRGAEHLHAAQRALKQGRAVILIPNHEAHFDAPAVDLALARAGVAELEARAVNVYGIRLEKKVYTRKLSDAYSRIRIFSPHDQPQTEAEAELKRALGENARKSAQEAAASGRPLIIFPQGKRSDAKQGALIEGLPSAIGILEELDNPLIVPICLDGTRNIMPPKKLLRPGFYRVTACEPLEYSALASAHPELRFKSLRRAMMTDIFRPIARAMPPEKRGFYADKV